MFLKYALEHDMALLIDWYRANKLSLNIYKTVLLKFWPEGRSFEINIEGIPLINKHHVKFLGVWLDDCLTWKEHSNTVLNRVKVNQKLLMNAKHMLDEKSLMTIYNVHIYSYLSYLSLVVWGSMLSAESRDKLYKAQKVCIRIVAKLKPRDSLHGVFPALRVIPFPDLIQLELTKLGFKVSNKYLPAPILAIFNANGGEKNINIRLGIRQSLTFKNINSFLCGSI